MLEFMLSAKRYIQIINHLIIELTKKNELKYPFKKETTKKKKKYEIDRLRKILHIHTHI